MLPTRVTRERKYGKHAFIHVWQTRVVSEAWARADLVRVARDLRRRGCSSKLVVCAVRDIVAGKEISNEKVTDALLRDAELRLRGVL